VRLLHVLVGGAYRSGFTYIVRVAPKGPPKDPKGPPRGSQRGPKGSPEDPNVPFSRFEKQLPGHDTVRGARA